MRGERRSEREARILQYQEDDEMRQMEWPGGQYTTVSVRLDR
jgi:hypothetical protein